MPTLIRLIVLLLILAGIAYGVMFALTIFVQPRDKDVTIRIPARELLPQTQRDPLVRREIDTTRSATPAPAPAAPAQEPAPAPEGQPDADGVVTRQQGVE